MQGGCGHSQGRHWQLQLKLSCCLAMYAWPALLQLDLHYCKLDAVAISHLAAASWPCLTTLDLYCTGLHHAAWQRLCSGCWPALTHLDVVGNSLSTGSVSLLAQSSGPARKMTDWAAQLTVLDLSDHVKTSERSLTASVIEQMTKIYWPCLEHLSYQHIVPDLNVMSHLVHGRWPKLSMLDIMGAALGAPAADACTGSLEALERASVDSKSAGCCSVWATQCWGGGPRSAAAEIRASTRCTAVLHRYAGAVCSPCVPGYMQLPKCFAQWLELDVHVYIPV